MSKIKVFLIGCIFSSLLMSETMNVSVTAYSLHHGQTDSTPFVGAWNNKLSNKDKMRSIAISQDMFGIKGLWNNKKVFVICNGKGRMYTIRDTMNKRWRKRLDICMGTDRKAAMRWGKRKCVMHYNMKRKKSEAPSKKNVNETTTKSGK